MAELVECIRACDINSDGGDSVAVQCIKTCIFSLTRCDLQDFDGVRTSAETGSWLPNWVSLALAVALIPATGLFAGLTIGLLSLDNVSLRILEQAGEPKEREYARKIIPIRKQGNLLLCTLLLGNTVINSAISILLADLTTGAIGLLASTFLILIFGEIIPQSICTRHGLLVGAHSIWVVKIFMALLSPIVWPTSVVLDWMLGRDIGNVYSREELKRLIDIHVMDPDAQAESGLTRADQRLIIGALDYKNKRVKDVMTSLEQCFMLEKSLRLTFQTMLAVYKSGFTRIPVYEGERQSIVAVLYAKDLILVDPDDSIEIGTVLSFRGRNVAHVSEEAPLDEVLRTFMTSNNHMLIAHAGNTAAYDGTDIASTEVTGLITLEDVMETLIQQEIVDETDIYEDVNTGLRRGSQRVDVANFLAMFEHKLHHLQVLSPAEMQAVFAFLTLNVEEFRLLAAYEMPLKGLISHAEVIEREAGTPVEQQGDSNNSPGGAAWGRSASLSSRFSKTLEEQAPDQVTLYERSVPSDAFTLILQGKVLIRTGAEGFELEVGPWNCLANKALVMDQYVPDFDAVGVAPLRVLRIRRPAFLAAMEATSLQPVVNYQRVRGSVLPSVLEIAAPEGLGTPPQGASPPAMPRSDFNAAAYLQRKSALHPRGTAAEGTSQQQRSRNEPLDHRIPQTTVELLAEKEQEPSEEHPLLRTQL